jgi:polyisoprenoid-binding protein YceI
MNRITRTIIIAALVVAIAGIGGFLYLTRPLAAVSQDVQASAETLEVTADDATTAVVYRIAQDESSVQFEIDEVLNGVDTHVVGSTGEVAGDIRVNFSDPSASEVGTLSINARTLATDNDRRNAAIGRFILQSEDAANEIITFAPTGLSGLPDSVAVGDAVEFQITGDLTVAGTTSSVTFSATVQVGEDQLTGSATATVLYSDFGLSIPNVPSVTDVSDEVVLTITFVANTVAA